MACDNALFDSVDEPVLEHIIHYAALMSNGFLWWSYAAVCRRWRDASRRALAGEVALRPVWGRHSTHVDVSPCRTVAARQDPEANFDKAVVALHHALPPSCPYFEVRVGLTTRLWAGSIRMRFSEQVPDDIEAREDIARSSTITDRELRRGDRLGLLLDSRGRSLYYLNGKFFRRERLAERVRAGVPLYGLADLFGRAFQAELVWELDIPELPSDSSVSDSDTGVTDYESETGARYVVNEGKSKVWVANVESAVEYEHEGVEYTERSIRELRTAVAANPSLASRTVHWSAAIARASRVAASHAAAVATPMTWAQAAVVVVVGLVVLILSPALWNAAVCSRSTLGAHEAARHGCVAALNAMGDEQLRVLGVETPLHSAARAGQLEAALVLLKRDNEALRSTRSPLGQTPLHVAAAAGYAQMVSMLLSYGANADAKDVYGRTPILLAHRADVIAVLAPWSNREKAAAAPGPAPKTVQNALKADNADAARTT
eukprot:m51a1_g3283 hypothetical protein (489) ;mRNA; f:258763-260814